MTLFNKSINFQVLYNLEEIKNKWVEVFAGHLTERERIDEIYIVDKHFRWTYVTTHESYCGPYFCKL